MSLSTHKFDALEVINGTEPVAKNFCVVCEKPNCNCLQHGKWACSDECCEIIIRGVSARAALAELNGEGE